MRAYEFINEAEVNPYEYEEYSNINVLHAETLLRKNCQQSLATLLNPIWRGLKSFR